MTEQTLPLPPKGPRRPVQADPAPAPGTAAAPIATWQLSQSGFGDVAIYPSSYGYAGGLVIAGFGDGAWNLAITNLGDGNIALGVTLTDDRGNTSTLYFNSHYPVSNNVLNNGGMTLWIDINAQNNYSSDRDRK